MVEITINSDQAKLIFQSPGNVLVRDPEGTVVGYISRDFTEQEIEAVKKRMGELQRVYTTQEVLDHLRSLESK